MSTVLLLSKSQFQIVIGLSPGVDESVNVVAFVKQATSVVKVATGLEYTSTLVLKLLIHPLSEVTVRVTL
jgi:hypothetical protein